MRNWIYLLYTLSIIVLLSACDYSDNPNPQIPQVIKSIIDPGSDQQVMALLSDVVYGQASGLRTMSSAIGDIDLSEAIRVEHLQDGVVRYTFLLITNQPYQFDNLIIRIGSDGEVSGYQLKYHPSMDWLNSMNGKIELDDFTGSITIADINGIDLIETSFAYGRSFKFKDVSPLASGRISDCGGDGSGGTGGGGGTGDGTGDGGTGGGTDGGGTGDGSGGTGGGSDGGGTGGGSPTPGDDDFEDCQWVVWEDILYISCTPAPTGGEHLVARIACDVGDMPEGDCIDDDCPDSPVGILDKNLLEIIVASLEEHPCTNELFMQIQNLSEEGIRDIIDQFAEEESQFYYEIKIVYSSSEFDNPNNIAETNWINGNGFHYQTLILSDYLNSATIPAIARTLMHEAIHAYLLSLVDYMSITPDQQQAFQSNFPLLWDYYVNNIGDGSYAHHQTMALNFVDTISQALAALFGDNFSEEFYRDLAWGALMDTSMFNNLDIEDQERIKNLNLAEDTNNTNAEGEPCN